jgi:phenylacetate-CoA ligase
MFSAEMKKKISEIWDMEVFDIYGLTEMCGPGVSANSAEHDGLHIWEDHFFAEIIDPETGEQLGPEEEGELVLTALTKEGMPVLRYRTRDITRLYDGPCNCGRTHVKHAPIKGRSDDMLIVKGTNIFPSQIEEAILPFDRVGGNWVMVLERTGDMDTITVRVETRERLSDAEKEEMAARIQKEIRVITTFGVRVAMLDPGELPASEGKARRVIDKR